MKTINQRNYWIISNKNNKNKLRIYIASGRVFHSCTSDCFFDVRYGVLKWTTLSGVFFVCINGNLNSRGPPLINLKKWIDWRNENWKIDQKEERKEKILIT